MAINRETLSSPVLIFVMYIAIACLGILGFRLIFPGEMAPLPIFSRNWRLIRGLLDILALFPALAFSALVVPFGIASEESFYTGSSQYHFQHLMTPLITAICAAGLYALLFFLVLPLAQNYETNLRFQGDVYRLAKGRAHIHGAAGEWLETAQFIGICDSVWENSPELTTLRNEIEIHLDESRYEDWHIGENESARDLNSATVSALPGQGQPMDAGEAIDLGEAALADERPFDAHWLATVGGRLAKEGSPEKTKAAELASRAWNQIESQQPNRRENVVYSHFQLKLSGYEAMVSGNWIQAYFIFRELLEKTPNDPDAENFLKVCEKGTKEIAFFIDEMEISLGEMFTGTVFSLPFNPDKGEERSVLRIASLSSSPDYAYGTGIEYMVFDANARPTLELRSPYGKILPIMLNDRPQVHILMRVLDRHDRNRHWEPTWTAQNNTVYQPDIAQITLNIDYETFLMLSEMRQGMSGMHIDTLFTAAKTADGTGYIPEVFQAEILNRLGGCLFFMPMAVIAIVIGWRFRAKYRPRYFFVLLLPVLPVVFNGFTYLYRTVFNHMGISLITNVGFSVALTLFIVILVFTFILSLILLAAQRD